VYTILNNIIMKLIADSGSTKTDWIVYNDGNVVKNIKTQGINPFHQSENRIEEVIVNELLPNIDEKEISDIYFYGSGCSESMQPLMKQLLSLCFHQGTSIEVNSDLLSAARALCGHDEGIACILGTGSNSCLYDGKQVVENVSPLGYILGDEGSGAVLGKLFINAIFKDNSFRKLRDDFLMSANFTLEEIIDKVYRQPLANRFLASTSVYIHNHLDNNDLNKLVEYNFRTFFKRNISTYSRPDLKVNFIGSVAYYFKSQLNEAASVEGFRIGVIEKSPLSGLMKYHN
jgi:glucosamine kinase